MLLQETFADLWKIKNYINFSIHAGGLIEVVRPDYTDNTMHTP